MTIQGLAALKQRVAVVSNKKVAEQYRDSFADQLSDLFGRSRWALTGLALTTWEQDVRERINELLQTHHGDIYKGQAVCVPSICHCWMLGYSQECALPTVVICCSERAILRRSMRVVIRHQLLKPRGFDIKGIAPYDLRLYGGSVPESSLSGEHNDDYLSRRYFSAPRADPIGSGLGNPAPLKSDFIAGLGRNVCGVGLVVDHSDRKATLGGALIINGKYRGLTSAHVLQDAHIATESLGSISQDAQMYDSDWAEEDSCQSDDDNTSGPCLATEQYTKYGTTVRPSEGIGQTTPETPSSDYYGKSLPAYVSNQKWYIGIDSAQSASHLQIQARVPLHQTAKQDLCFIQERNPRSFEQMSATRAQSSIGLSLSLMMTAI